MPDAMMMVRVFIVVLFSIDAFTVGTCYVREPLR